MTLLTHPAEQGSFEGVTAPLPPLAGGCERHKPNGPSWAVPS